MDSRSDIDSELERLASRLRALVKQLPQDEVLQVFAEELQRVVARVPAEHDAYVHERVHDMLAAHGLIPDDPATG